MVHRNFPQADANLERDADGHRTGFKVYIKVRRTMKPESFLRWGVKQRIHIGKNRYVWSYYASSKSMGYPNGIPIEHCKDDQKLGEWLINYMSLSEGETYAIHSWRGTGGKKNKPVLTRVLALIVIHDTEKMKFTISKTGRLRRYWFRKADKK